MKIAYYTAWGARRVFEIVWSETAVAFINGHVRMEVARMSIGNITFYWVWDEMDMNITRTLQNEYFGRNENWSGE